MTQASTFHLDRDGRLSFRPSRLLENIDLVGEVFVEPEHEFAPDVHYVAQNSGTGLMGVPAEAGTALDPTEFVTSAGIGNIWPWSDMCYILEVELPARNRRMLFKVTVDSTADTAAGMPQERRRAQLQDEPERRAQRQRNQAAVALLKTWRADTSDQREQVDSLERTMKTLDDARARAGARRLFP